MVRLYNTDNPKPINPVNGVTEIRIIDSHRREEDKNKKKKKSDSNGFSEIYKEEIEKLQKVRRR